MSDPLDECRHSRQYIKFSTILLLSLTCVEWKEAREQNVVEAQAQRQLVPVLWENEPLWSILGSDPLSGSTRRARVYVCLGLMYVLQWGEARSQNFILCVEAARRGAGDINFAAAAPSRLTISWPAEFTAPKLRRLQFQWGVSTTLHHLMQTQEHLLSSDLLSNFFY